jgi:uncharacterized protein
MIQLTPIEARVFGVLIEKSTTTPEQYPLSINALTNGSNQKNNRDPVLNLSDDEVFDAVESLRDKQLVVRVDTVGSRVHKYRHMAGETLRCRAGELAVLAELLLRGPQTLGELRGRASRMSPLNSLDDAKTMIRALGEHTEPLVKEIPPAPGSRAERYAQLLCPTLHPLDAPSSPVPSERAVSERAVSERPSALAASVASSIVRSSDTSLVDRVAALESEVRTLRDALRRLAQSVGEDDPLAPVNQQAAKTT